MTAVLFVLAAATGALGRYGVNQLGVGSTWTRTLGVNVAGAFAFGLLAANAESAATLTVVGTGLLGSFTTFSTFALEASTGPARQRLLVTGSTLVLGLGAGALGMTLG